MFNWFNALVLTFLELNTFTSYVLNQTDKTVHMVGKTQQKQCHNHKTQNSRINIDREHENLTEENNARSGTPNICRLKCWYKTWIPLLLTSHMWPRLILDIKYALCGLIYIDHTPSRSSLSFRILPAVDVKVDRRGQRDRNILVSVSLFGWYCCFLFL